MLKTAQAPGRMGRSTYSAAAYSAPASPSPPPPASEGKCKLDRHFFSMSPTARTTQKCPSNRTCSRLAQYTGEHSLHAGNITTVWIQGSAPPPPLGPAAAAAPAPRLRLPRLQLAAPPPGPRVQVRGWWRRPAARERERERDLTS